MCETRHTMASILFCFAVFALIKLVNKCPGHPLHLWPLKLKLHLQVFHAGTATNDSGEIVATGGRVLGVTATGKTALEAQQKAYQVGCCCCSEPDNMYSILYARMPSHATTHFTVLCCAGSRCY